MNCSDPTARTPAPEHHGEIMNANNLVRTQRSRGRLARRDFLGVATASLAALGAPRLLHAQEADAQKQPKPAGILVKKGASGTETYARRRVLGPTEGTEYAGGVGTPFIVNHPYTDQNYFLFTGWKTRNGSRREAFVGEINQEFTISNVRKILQFDFPGDLTAGGHLAVHATWDEHNKR